MGTAVEKPKDPPAPAGKALAKASVNPINLGVAAGAATLAIGLGSFPLGILGGLAYVAMVAYDALTPSATPAHQRVLAAPLPDPKHVFDPETKSALIQIIANKAELERVLADTPPDVVANLATSLASIYELDSHAGRLIRRAEDIARHLAGVKLPSLVEDVKQLASRIDATSDPDAKRTFTEAKAARMDEIHTLRELKTTKDRIDADLMRLVAVLSALPTKVVHMRALDAQAMDQLSGDLNTELEAFGKELKTSEDVLKQLGEVIE